MTILTTPRSNRPNGNISGKHDTAGTYLFYFNIGETERQTQLKALKENNLGRKYYANTLIPYTKIHVIRCYGNIVLLEIYYYCI